MQIPLRESGRPLRRLVIEPLEDRRLLSGVATTFEFNPIDFFDFRPYAEGFGSDGGLLRLHETGGFSGAAVHDSWTAGGWALLDGLRNSLGDGEGIGYIQAYVLKSPNPADSVSLWGQSLTADPDEAPSGTAPDGWQPLGVNDGGAGWVYQWEANSPDDYIRPGNDLGSFTFTFVPNETVLAGSSHTFWFGGDNYPDFTPGIDFDTFPGGFAADRPDDRIGTAYEATLQATAVTGESASVVGRHLFYNNSAFDGRDPAADARDDAAVAVDKHALLPGATANFSQYTSYSRGINGVMVDVENLPPDGTITAADFEFRVGNDGDPAGWAVAAAPIGVSVRRGAGVGGSDRVSLIWADNAVRQQWLEVRVKATPQTGLADDDVFYFGNAIGETGNSPTDARVNATDQIATRNNPRFHSDPAAVDDRYDHNRDTMVNVLDQLFARNHPTFFLNALQLITVPDPAESSTHLATAAVDVLLATLAVESS